MTHFLSLTHPAGSVVSLYLAEYGLQWIVDDEFIRIQQAKSWFPVEYNLIMGMQKISQYDPKKNSKINNNYKKIGIKMLTEAENDSKCEEKWGARPYPVEASKYFPEIKSI